MLITHDSTPQGIAGSEAVVARFELFVRDLWRSIEFYRRVLGFEPEHSTVDPHSRYVGMQNGHIRVGLGAFEGLPETHYFRQHSCNRFGVGVEIVIEVTDLVAYERRARLAGVVFERLQERPWGRRDFRVVDPDGYYIRVTNTLPSEEC